MQITIGADPELFLVREDSLLPAGVVTTGTKEAPVDMGEGYAVHADNVCLEFNIPPAKSRDEFVNSIARGLDICQGVAAGCALMYAPAQEFTEAQLQMVGAEAFLFHCDPDLRVWGGKDEDCYNWRVAGGHVHLGYDEELEAMQIAASCDYHMGLRSILFEPPVPGAKRRLYYGKAGSYREKSYGIEYRTLSNYWLETPQLTGSVYDWAVEAIHRREDVLDYMHIVTPEELVDIINNCNRKGAEDALKRLGLEAA